MPRGVAGAGWKSVTWPLGSGRGGSPGPAPVSLGRKSNCILPPSAARSKCPDQEQLASGSIPSHPTHPWPSRYLSGGQGKSPFLPIPMFWDTAAMQFSGRTMSAAVKTPELARDTRSPSQIWREIVGTRLLGPICAGETPPPSRPPPRRTAGSRRTLPCRRQATAAAGSRSQRGPAPRLSLPALRCRTESWALAAPLPVSQPPQGKRC